MTWLLRPSREDFTHPVESLEELSPIYQQAVACAILPGEKICSLIIAPSTGRMRGRRPKNNLLFRFLLPWEESPERVLVLTGARLLVARRQEPSQPPELIAIPLGDILSLQTATVLLPAWFEVDWVAGAEVQQEFIPFNATSIRFFTHLAELMRQGICGSAQPSQPAEKHHLDILAELPYKFQNMIPRYTLLPKEQVLEVIYRPALWKNSAGFFKTLAAPRMVLAVTNLHLLLIEEDRDGTESNYGFITTFIPLDRINQAVVVPSTGSLRLAIQLAWQGASRALELEFPPNLQAEVTHLAGRLNYSQHQSLS